MRTSTSPNDEKLLREKLTEIQSGLADLSAAEEKSKTVAEKISQLERDLAAKLRSFDPADDEAVAAVADMQGRLDVLQNWMANSHPLRQAIQKLSASLMEAKPLIQRTAQSRSTEESTISETHWYPTLLGLECRKLDNQIRAVRNATKTVLGDISVLLERRRGATLTGDERRTGIFYGQGGFAIRRLELSEIQAGVAND